MISSIQAHPISRCYFLGQVFTGRQALHQHDDVIKWKHFPRYWPFVRGIHPSRVNSPHNGKWRGALMFSMICALIKMGKQSRGRWFDTPSRSLWRHCNEFLLSLAIAVFWLNYIGWNKYALFVFFWVVPLAFGDENYYILHGCFTATELFN